MNGSRPREGSVPGGQTPGEVDLQKDTTVEKEAGAAPPAERVQAEIARLRGEAKARVVLGKKLAPFAREAAFEDLQAYRKKLEQLTGKLERGTIEELGAAPLFDALTGYAREAGERMRQRLGRELKRRCEEAKLGFRVVRSEEPIEVRIPPFAVEIDFKSGRATLRFAKQELQSCPADAERILAAHGAALRQLSTPFDPGEFHEACWRAYRATLAVTETAAGERVEILDFVPHLALQLQSKRFNTDPVGENYRGYSRAQFAFDVLRLRRAQAMSHGGRRIELGVATGISATKKARVVYLEDEEGRGQYTLTVRFRAGGQQENER